MIVHTTDYNASSEAETVTLGKTLGASLHPGAVLLLEGPLGAGKTAFARGLALGLGAGSEDVSSPTFTLIQEYAGRVRMLHADLYRLTPDEVDDLGLDDLADGAVLAVEWPDRWRAAPVDAIRVTIEPTAPHTRRITVRQLA